jgi:DNA-binding NtrC family response regulator
MTREAGNLTCEPHAACSSQADSTMVRPANEEPTTAAQSPNIEDVLGRIAESLIVLLDSYSGRGLSERELMEAIERNVIMRGLTRFGGSQLLTAGFLNIKPTTLWAKIRKHKITTVIRFECDKETSLDDL